MPSVMTSLTDLGLMILRFSFDGLVLLVHLSFLVPFLSLVRAYIHVFGSSNKSRVPLIHVFGSSNKSRVPLTWHESY